MPIPKINLNELCEIDVPWGGGTLTVRGYFTGAEVNVQEQTQHASLLPTCIDHIDRPYIEQRPPTIELHFQPCFDEQPIFTCGPDDDPLTAPLDVVPMDEPKIAEAINASLRKRKMRLPGDG